MHCPICNHADSRVLDTRLSQDGTSIRRRRQCDRCDYRFSTLEEIELLDVTIVKRDGRREAYRREKMERGLKKALEKRSYTESEFRSLVHAIERHIHRHKSSELRSAEVGEVVMEELKRFDKVAYIRFASVYRAFEDVESFGSEIRRLMPKKIKSIKKTEKSRRAKKRR
ncbi:MAG: transcriptional regulator NrdR [bacterium]|nr:transcriptional regulator NrdR [bacterium]